MEKEGKQKNKSRRRRKRKSKLHIITFIFLVIIIIVCLVIFIPKFKEKVKQNKLKNELLGSWTTDGYTVYEFYKEGKGALKIQNADYIFLYSINENTLFIDFENEKSIDSNFEFSFEDGKLILRGINGTSGTYAFTKN